MVLGGRMKLTSEERDVALIEIRGLRKIFRGHLGIGKTTVLHGIDLTVRRGEVFGLLGHNGAGKTTTLKALLGLLKPDGGVVKLCGFPPGDPRSRLQVGYLPEHPYFYDYLTGREFLHFYARLRGVPAARRAAMVEAAIDRVKLRDAADRPLRKYSKGMVQRIGLAQAIQHDPELVILDEPMSGLDPVGRRDVRDIILELREAGKTVCFSSHILQDAEMICDRVAILKGGRVVRDGSLSELISDELEWIELSVDGLLPDGLAAELLTSDGQKHLLRVENVAALREVLSRLDASGARVLSIGSKRGTLEDVFLAEVRAPEQIGSDKVAQHG